MFELLLKQQIDNVFFSEEREKTALRHFADNQRGYSWAPKIRFRRIFSSERASFLRCGGTERVLARGPDIEKKTFYSWISKNTCVCVCVFPIFTLKKMLFTKPSPTNEPFDTVFSLTTRVTQA